MLVVIGAELGEYDPPPDGPLRGTPYGKGEVADTLAVLSTIILSLLLRTI
jgi:hypothetical protein